jgi:hypothetical protein
MRVLATVILIAVAAPVHAEAPASQPAGAPQPAGEQVSPWARGVSPARQARALEHYRAGNRLFADEQYSQALGRYERALEYWSHPSIHYNVVECLINLGRNLEAHEHLKAAMRHGAAPLGERLFRQARTYSNMLERSLARIKIVCWETGTQVSLDGRPLFVGPGGVTRIVTPGLHAVLAAKPGFITVARQPRLAPGKLTVVRLVMVPRKPEVAYERRWKRRWLPWTVLGVGATIAAAALPVYLAARSDFETHAERFAARCSAGANGGCTPSELSSLTTPTLNEWDELVALEGRAYDRYYASIGLLGAGAAVTALGVALVVLNQPRRVERPSEVPTLRLAGVRPTLTPDGGGLGVSWTF